MNPKILLATITPILLLIIWWWFATPPEYLQPGAAIQFPEEAVNAARRIDAGAAFDAALQVLPAELPGHDDIIFLHGTSRLLATGMDGRIWLHDRASGASEVFVDPPLMAAGLHESPLDPDQAYFCASRLWGDSYPDGERVGLYRLDLPTRAITPVVLDVPDTRITGGKVWGLRDDRAPRLAGRAGGKRWPKRPLAFCNDLEISADGRRIYFSEPFSYAGASMGGGTVHEVLAYRGNGRIWMHDLGSGETRLVVEGYHFLDGVLYDLHPQGTREVSILSSLTPGFRIMRFHIDGPRAGEAGIVQDGLPGMCDGMDRDAKGNIWCGLFTLRSNTLTWLHAHPGVKQVLQRLPLNNLPQPRSTGVLALSPDATRLLYYAAYEGPKVAKIASVIPGADGLLYLTPFLRNHRGLVVLENPLLK